MLRLRLGNLGFSEVSFGSFLVVIFKARFWLKDYGPILPHFTVLIFVRVFRRLFQYSVICRYSQYIKLALTDFNKNRVFVFIGFVCGYN